MFAWMTGEYSAVFLYLESSNTKFVMYKKYLTFNSYKCKIKVDRIVEKEESFGEIWIENVEESIF